MQLTEIDKEEIGTVRPVLLSQQDNVADLVSKIRSEDLSVYQAMRHIHTEAAFVGRRFVCVETFRRRTSEPRMVGSFSIISFQCTDQEGSKVAMVHDQTNKMMTVGHVPTRLFHWPVFVSVPVYMGMKWDLKEYPNGNTIRTLLFGLAFKQVSSVELKNDSVACVTLNEYLKMSGQTFLK